ncbi:hypothetical protein B0H15DRAFT_841884 [Mycena belliarum]|uniref:Uncharacterized protein n=1 Tax=Mycena belliarum TaxID=1033014 RepID=A0AAD6XUA5_9AGAR|nr:hypothetical protein B0H15DRAFT_841884 [Mycena belliae]
MFRKWMDNVPKHWDVDDQKAYPWQPYLTNATYPIERLMGTYVFVSLFNEDQPNMYMLGAQNPGFLKLGTRQGAPEELQNVYGYFQVANDTKRGAFIGLMPQHEAMNPPRTNLRKFDLVTAYENRIPLKGHGLDVLDVVDDNGNNYIAIMLEYFAEGSNCISYMGKKQLRDEDRIGLTEVESLRLGIGISFDELERARGVIPSTIPASS